MGMPLNSIPSTTTLEAVKIERKQAGGESLYVDVGLWGGVVPDNLDSIDSLLKSPYIFGIKAFLAPLPPAAGYQAVSPDQLLKAAKICGPTGKPILVHSELMTMEQSLNAVEEAFGAAQDDSSYAAHLQSRPAEWEQDAVRVVCQATQPDSQSSSSGCRMHIVHLSDARGCLPIIQACKETLPEGTLTVETCPHYLFLDDSLIEDGDTRVKCFPPIRDPENRELLWSGLSNGLGIDMIASDHSPCEPGMRMMESKNVKEAWGGLSALQYQLQETWSEAINRKATPRDMAKWWSENPAKLIGMSKQKGYLAEGYNADLCLWEPQFKGAPNSYSREYHRWKGTTIFADNPDSRGRVIGTWVAGNNVYDGIADCHYEPAGILLQCP